VVFEGQTITWSELYKKVETLSGFFSSALGQEDQAVVCLILTNSIDFVTVYLAILYSGHIAMPIDPVYKKLEIEAIIELISPAMIVLEQRYKRQIGEPNAPVYMAEQILDKSFDPSKNLRLPADEQIASLTFTSGSSGQPKAVPNTHTNHIWNVKACSKVWDWTTKDSLLINLPLSHMHGLIMGLSGAIYHSNTIYLHQQSFDTKAILDELASGKISLFTHGPIAYMKMLEQSGEYDLSKVRLMISGSAPFPPKLWQDFKQRFKAEVIETYGSTETGRIAANTVNAKKLGSPGKILPGVKVRLGPGDEILVKSAGLFPGYWNNDEATKQASAPNGYWRTGDIGEIKDGYVFLKGRTQERIRKFGYTVSPRDVEWALLENPAIKEAFVMGIQSKSDPNDKIYYFIAGEASEAEITEYCKQNMPFSWRPDKIQLVSALPRTHNGKPHVKQLHKMAENF
jgi:malonyl-CoA/methylmalonyl-CoA synthetase